MNHVYEAVYQANQENLPHVVKMLADQPSRVIGFAVEHGGREGAQALFDAVMDAGHRAVLVKAIDAPSLPGWVREQLEVFLYGTSRQTAALFRAKTLH